jgi:hypothetical protein
MSLTPLITAAALAASAGLALAQPVNDLCTAALPISAPPSAVNGTTTAATSSTGVFNTCATAHRDVWYTYTHTGPSTGVSFETCGAAAWDTVVSAFTGSCGSLVPVACNDDTCGLQSSITISATTGTTYYIRVGQYNDNATQGGAFTLNVSVTTPPPPPSDGPDVIVGNLGGAIYYGKVGNTRAYSLGTDSCNVGNQNLLWIASTNQHPVIGQSLYRIENGRFEMIGSSWLKHGFTALTGSLCGTCSGQGGAVLGVGCSDPYSASLNGSQSNLGPRSHVNATTGHFPYPFTTPGAGYMVPPAAAATIGRRMQVEESDMFRPGAVYISEAQYIAPDDASYVNSSNRRENGLNNASYRVSTGYVPDQTTGVEFNVGGTTVRRQPAIMYWPVIDPSVIVTTHDYTDAQNYVCRFYVGSKVTNNNNGTWTYTYTIFNLNSDRSASKFELPCTNVTASNPYYRGLNYHSGESFSMSERWNHVADATGISWSTPSTFAQNPNSSAIRWGTAATFAVTTNTPPVTGNASLTYFKTAGTLTLNGIRIPSSGSCPADFNADTIVDFFDYLDFVAAFSSNSASSDFNADTIIDFFDYLDFVAAFSSPC